MRESFFVKVRCRHCEHVAVKRIEYYATGNDDRALADALDNALQNRKMPLHNCGKGIVGVFEVIAASFDQHALE